LLAYERIAITFTVLSKVSPLALDTQRRPTHVSSSYLARAIDVQRARSFRADEHVAIAIP
jgi:hypothetical protein